MLSMSFGLMIYLYGGMFWSGFSIGRPSLEELIKILKENKINLKCAKQASLDYKELIEKFYNRGFCIKNIYRSGLWKITYCLKRKWGNQKKSPSHKRRKYRKITYFIGKFC